MLDRNNTARLLAREYLRVPEWATLSEDDAHTGQSAIRCAATRIGVYTEFNAALDELKPDDT